VLEQRIREILRLAPDAPVHEVGVFTPAPAIYEGGIAGIDLPDLGLEDHFSEEPHVQPLLPRGRARRWDVDPRVLVLEEIPEPVKTVGPVTRLGDDEWVIDTRGETAAALIDCDDHGLVIWGQAGQTRLFTLGRATP